MRGKMVKNKFKIVANQIAKKWYKNCEKIGSPMREREREREYV